MRFFSLAVAALMLPAGSAAAQSSSFADSATGFGVAAPPGWTVTSHEDTLGTFTVVADAVEPGGAFACRAGYKEVSLNTGRTQQEMNALVGDSGWRERVTAQLGPIYDILEIEPFKVAGIAGAVALGVYKSAAGDDALSTLLYLVETPNGRTVMFCSAPKTVLVARRAEIDRLAAGLTPGG